MVFLHLLHFLLILILSFSVELGEFLDFEVELI